MTDTSPSPPPSPSDDRLDELSAELPDGLVRALEDQPPERLRVAARYAEALAEHRDREERPDDGGPDDDPDENREDGKADGDQEDGGDRPKNVPDGVPSKATLTVKEINDNRYYYWQWREGDAIKSQYEGPVDADG